MSKPQRFCIFCDRAGLTREHFWPEWAAPYLPRRIDPSYETGRIDFTKKNVIARAPRMTKRQGGVQTRKLRIVCKACNTGWMSGLEEATKGTLLPIFLEQPFTMTAGQRGELARWIALKAIISEYNSPDNHVTTKEQRRALMTERLVPHGFRIWIGRSLARSGTLACCDTQLTSQCRATCN